MRRFFLEAKAWYLFVLIVGGMVSSQGLFMIHVEFETGPPTAPWEAIPPMFVWTGCLLAWLWALGTGLNEKVPRPLRMGTGFFKFALAYAFLYMLAFGVVLIWIAGGGSGGPKSAVALLLFHLFAMFCMFYVLYFVAKNLTTAERQQKVTFYDYSGPFFLLWFFPLGIWVIQPRVNRMFREEG